MTDRPIFQQPIIEDSGTHIDILSAPKPHHHVTGNLVAEGAVTFTRLFLSAATIIESYMEMCAGSFVITVHVLNGMN